MTKASSPKVLVIADHAPSVGVSRLTTSVAVTEMASKPLMAACDAVMTVDPAPTMVTLPVDELIVATSVLLDANFQAAELVEVGSFTSNAASPKVAAGMEKRPSVGLTASTSVDPVDFPMVVGDDFDGSLPWLEREAAMVVDVSAA